MSRVATIPLQRSLADAIQRNQQKLAISQIQIATGKKATDYASLGTEAVRTVSARTLIARQEAQGAVAKRVGVTLTLHDANLSGIHTAGSELHKSVLTVLGTGRSAGLQELVEGAFAQFRSSINASEGGIPLFAGSRIEAKPFKPETLADTIGLAPANAFSNDEIRASARVADGLDVEFGIVASEVGTGIFSAFRTLAEAGTIGDEPTAAQMAALSKAAGELGEGLKELLKVNAENGRKQAQVERLGIRAEERTLVFKDLISGNEDADLGQVAIELAQQKTALEASYSVFSQLSKLSLINFLR